MQVADLLHFFFGDEWQKAWQCVSSCGGDYFVGNERLLALGCRVGDLPFAGRRSNGDIRSRKRDACMPDSIGHCSCQAVQTSDGREYFLAGQAVAFGFRLSGFGDRAAYKTAVFLFQVV